MFTLHISDIIWDEFQIDIRKWRPCKVYINIYIVNPSSTTSTLEMESLSSKQFFVASLFIVLAICSYMHSSLAATPNPLSSELFTTTVAFPNSPTTHDSQIKEKAFATDIITTSVALTISPTTGDSRINEKNFATKIIDRKSVV